jgi:hypothetical protein
MLLEKFNDYPKLISVDLKVSPHKYSIVEEVGGEKIDGIGDIVNGNLMFFYVTDGKLLFNANDIEIDLCSEDISLLFEQKNERGTFFEIKKGEVELYTLSYEPWWRNNPITGPAGLGVSADEEEDFLAYLTLMSKSSSRLQHLVRKYT